MSLRVDSLQSAFLVVCLVGALTAACSKRPEKPAAAPAASNKRSVSPPSQDSGVARPGQRPGMGMRPSHRSAGEARQVNPRLMRMHLSEPKPRRYTESVTDEQRAQLATAAERLHGAADTESRVEILQEFTGVCHPDVVRLVQLAQGDAEAEVRRAALDLLDGYDSADIIPVAMRAMSDPDKEVRLAAIAALRAVMDARVGEALLRGLDDPDEDVRQAAVLALGEKAYAVQAPLIETTLKSGHADMKSEVLYLLKEAKSHAAMDLLLTGLNDPAPEFRDEVNDAIYFLISQRFTSYTQAARWWGQNRDKYDDELIEKEGVEIPPP